MNKTSTLCGFLTERKHLTTVPSVDFEKNIYLNDALENIFYQIIDFLHQKGEFEYKNLFVDGTKIEFVANKYSRSRSKKSGKNASKS
jgi:transposase